MWSFIWHTFFFDPVYNGLVFFIDIVPGGDVGLAIILITIVNYLRSKEEDNTEIHNSTATSSI